MSIPRGRGDRDVISGQEKERPLTHDLMALLLEAVGARVERIVINDLKSGTYFGRHIIVAENEIQQRKIIELDARPSDCIALATQQKAPIYVSEDVWSEVEDMSDVLEKIEQSRGTRRGRRIRGGRGIIFARRAHSSARNAKALSGKPGSGSCP